MIHTKVTLNATEELRKGAQLISTVVGSTLGPRAHYVILEPNYGHAHPTKDGVTVASQVSSSSPVERLAIDILKQAASKTASLEGDGTTSTILFGQAFYEAGLKLLSLGFSLPLIRERFNTLAKEVVKNIRSNLASKTEDVDQLKFVVKVSSSHDPEITANVSAALDAVGPDGVIVLADSKTTSSEVEIHEGYQIDRSYISAYFTDDGTKAVLNDPLILVTDLKISSAQDAIHLMELAHAASKPLVIIAEDVEGPALATLIVNNVQKRIRVAALRAPSYGENRTALLEDIAAMCSARFISASSGSNIASVTSSDFGRAQAVHMSRNHTVLVKPKTDIIRVHERVNRIKELLSEHTPDSFFYQQLLTRMGKLSSKMATIHVAAPSESALKEIKDRYEDALRAMWAAASSGVVAGAFTSVIHSLPASTDPISKAFKEALLYPFKVLCENSGASYEVSLEKILSYDYPTGLYITENAAHVTSLISDEATILDPASVVTSAILNGLSAALLLVSSRHVINQTKESYNPSMDEVYPSE